MKLLADFLPVILFSSRLPRLPTFTSRQGGHCGGRHCLFENFKPSNRIKPVGSDYVHPGLGSLTILLKDEFWIKNKWTLHGLMGDMILIATRGKNPLKKRALGSEIELLWKRGRGFVPGGVFSGACGY